MKIQLEIQDHSKCHMQERCNKYEMCPINLVHKMISGKWKILILWYLTPNPLRFSDLRRKLPDVTQKMLTQQLRSLESHKIIYRKVYPVVPPKVEYGLTDAGKKLIPVLETMYSCGIDYMNHSD
ncbi:winged helix-turn-helix transcriptional regulator [Paraclostridium bifermentans]|uniref:winged helix-turn-helix transcriptional regulator n=1 Tax=Paraclostridium bifermentans TaxID=1490 RepID=UPI00359C7407